MTIGRRNMVGLAAVLVSLACTCGWGRAAALVVPIPSVATPAPPAYLGAPAAAHQVGGVARVPQNPFMAPNGSSEIHDDGWQTDAYAWGGPLGRSPAVTSSLLSRDCGSIAFDPQGRLVTDCIGLTGPELFLIDPTTLATVATFALPPRTPEDLLLNSGNIFQDFTGGGYFYLDNHDQVVTATTTQHIYVIAERGNGFALVHDYNLTSVLTPTEEITSALPDSHGLLWFVARRDGVVGTLSLGSGAIHVVRLGAGADGEIENSFAVGAHGGVYIATNRKLYRFGASPSGAPVVAWAVRYPNSGEHKPGQVDDGTGTTPSVMQGGFVNITDNADPMDVVVYRTAVRLPARIVRVDGRRRRRGRLPREVCRVPVFERGASDTENSLIAAGRSMIVENNFGYRSPLSGVLTAPGFARVDLDRNGRGCRLVWTNRSMRAPTVVSKLSLANGLIYTYTISPGSSEPWYWTAIDFRTGRVVWRRYAGAGVDYNNNYAGIAVARSGHEYLGVIGGVISLRDS